MDVLRKLPIGVQDFENLRSEGFIYIDKTRYIYDLAHYGKAYFLSRPRRFGKSLLLSTMRAYFEGKRELFRGLKIEELKGDGGDAWIQYPVFYFDLNKKNFKSGTARRRRRWPRSLPRAMPCPTPRMNGSYLR